MFINMVVFIGFIASEVLTVASKVSRVIFQKYTKQMCCRIYRMRYSVDEDLVCIVCTVCIKFDESFKSMEVEAVVTFHATSTSPQFVDHSTLWKYYWNRLRLRGKMNS